MNTGFFAKCLGVLAVLGLLAACGGGSSSSPSAAAAAPAITTQPVNVAIAEGQNAQFTVVVSGTPTPTLQWQWSTDGGASWSDINGETGSVLNVINAALDGNGQQYRVVASNSEGTVNSNTAMLSVVVRTWGTAALIETGTNSAYGPKIAIDAQGNAIVVWQQSNGVVYSIWTRRYTAGEGWGTPALIENDDTGDASASQIAIDGNGNAIAVWTQSYRIWASRYSAGQWGAPTLIDGGDTYADGVQIAINTSGNAVAVWTQSGDAAHSTWANHYTVGEGWGTATLIESDDTVAAANAQIAINADGDVIAVWSHTNGTVGSIWANRYAEGQWGAAAVIETDAGDAHSPQVVIDASGNALAVWSQSDGTTYNIMANRYTAGTGWGIAAPIETDNAGSADGPEIAVDANGNALAVWSQSNGTVNNIWSNRYTVGTGWGIAQLIENDNGSYADSPQIAFDANGNAMAVWHQYRPITYNRYTAGIGWGAAALVDPNTANEPTLGPQIALHANGDAWAVWPQWDGTRENIMANRYQ